MGSSAHSLPYTHPYSTPTPPRPLLPQRFTVEVHDGDIVVAATDGLFDNVYPDEAAQLVTGADRGAGGAGAFSLHWIPP